MKRHADLLQLSREHHTALKLARLARFASDAGNPEAIAQAARTITSKFAEEIEAHFLAEEQVVLPALLAHGANELVNRTLEEHKILRALNQQLQQADGPILAHFGQMLYDHVRFEERELFERAQELLYSEH
ncbi:MAG: hemerythrin domain-containing protein [Dechloromonas sp.]|uniref:Hemerythrin domain-containing protein n=1 Tax=Candidatus Dechloromonas phosphorivorans TaxID=2899244 RepID=A0A935K0H0_9RHOO|nr:hemerythrin domain-containing protein [Candidatus Dechloromonas phosphorivorans]